MENCSNNTYWHALVNRNGTSESCAYDYNSYFGSVYGDVHSFFKWFLGILTLLAIAATGATLLIAIGCKRFHMQHHIFPANITIAGLMTACSVGLRIVISSPSEECWLFCKLLVFTPCFAALVSNISILMVAVYQLINIRIDPFGSRSIINTPRCIIVIILTWSVVGALGIMGILFFRTSLFLLLLTALSISATVFIGCSYFLIYRSVTGTTSAIIHSMQRKEENNRIVQTIALVYGANFFLAILPSAYWMMVTIGMTWGPLLYLATMSNVLSSVVNSIVYWWRMKEFNDLMPRCRQNRHVDPIVDQSFKTKKMVIEVIK